MTPRVNLVAILLTLSCVSRALESSRLAQRERDVYRGYPLGKKVLKDVQDKVVSYSSVVLHGDEKTRTARGQSQESLVLAKNDVEGREHPRKRKRKMDKAMVALLMAYKMKFLALIPTLVGGLILLKATALLAGFFFALFAAVLGLKVH